MGFLRVPERLAKLQTRIGGGTKKKKKH